LGKGFEILKLIAKVHELLLDFLCGRVSLSLYVLIRMFLVTRGIFLWEEKVHVSIEG
jgi:hypothetical protein